MSDKDQATEPSITIRTGPVIKIGVAAVVGLISAMVYQTYSVGRYVSTQEGRLDTLEKGHNALEVRVAVGEKIQGQTDNRMIVMEEHDRSQSGDIREARVAASEQSKALSAAFVMLQTQISAMDASQKAQMADFNAKLNFLVDKSRGRTDAEPNYRMPPFDRAGLP